jgi:small subunit ribosomal protein S4
LEVISGSVAGNASRFPWIEFNASNLSGTFLNYPEREQIPENIREQLIVELYSK